MKKTEYKGEAFTNRGIIEMLRMQGLCVEDEQRAIHILENVSYARLKNYLIPLMADRQEHRFIPGATFEQAYALYGFDRRLRELIFHEMEKIEISIRTRVAFASNLREKGYWFLNPEHFKSESKHEYILKHLRNDLQRTDNEGILNFRKKYTNDFPPSWLTLEAVSMGTLVTIYDNLSDDELKDRIASYYGLPKDLFSSWVWHLVKMRNNCAHHSRVWDNVCSVKPALPHDLAHPFPPMQPEDRGHVYMTFCILRYFINVIKPENTFAQRLKLLVNSFPVVMPEHMGFPDDWQNLEFWD